MTNGVEISNFQYCTVFIEYCKCAILHTKISPVYQKSSSRPISHLRWYTTKENFFSDSNSIKMNFRHDVGGVPGTLEMICVSQLLS